MRFESPKCVQMRLRLGQGPRWGSLQPDFLAVFVERNGRGMRVQIGRRLLHGAEAGWIMDAPDGAHYGNRNSD